MINVDEEESKNSAEEAKKNLAHYRNLLCFMGANVPIEALCLPKVIENILIKEGYLRAYDLIGTDLKKIKGLGPSRASLLATRLDEFFTVQI